MSEVQISLTEEEVNYLWHVLEDHKAKTTGEESDANVLCSAFWKLRKAREGGGWFDVSESNRLSMLLRRAGDTVATGIEYAQESLGKHEVELGRTIRKNRYAAEAMEEDIREMKGLREELYQTANRMDYPLSEKKEEA